MGDTKQESSGECRRRWQPAPGDALDVFSICEDWSNPKLPFVVRRYLCTKDGAELDPLMMRCAGIRMAREVLRREAGRDLECIQPMPGDEPDLIESWI